MEPGFCNVCQCRNKSIPIKIKTLFFVPLIIRVTSLKGTNYQQLNPSNVRMWIQVCETAVFLTITAATYGYDQHRENVCRCTLPLFPKLLTHLVNAFIITTRTYCGHSETCKQAVSVIADPHVLHRCPLQILYIWQ